jgi:WhiB family redox-sensing transcriptional regulator
MTAKLNEAQGHSLGPPAASTLCPRGTADEPGAPLRLIPEPLIQGVSSEDVARNGSACLDEHPELFFPIGNSHLARLQIEKAKAVCGRCEVVQACLKRAMESDQDTGVWGGLSEDERRTLKRRNARGLRAGPVTACARVRNRCRPAPSPGPTGRPTRFGAPASQHKVRSWPWQSQS